MTPGLWIKNRNYRRGCSGSLKNRSPWLIHPTQSVTRRLYYCAWCMTRKKKTGPGSCHALLIQLASRIRPNCVHCTRAPRWGCIVYRSRVRLLNASVLMDAGVSFYTSIKIGLVWFYILEILRVRLLTASLSSCWRVFTVLSSLRSFYAVGSVLDI